MKSFARERNGGGTSILHILVLTLSMLMITWLFFLIFCWEEGMTHSTSSLLDSQVAFVGKAVAEAENEITFLLGSHHDHEIESVHLNKDTADAHIAGNIHIEQLRGSVNHGDKDIHSIKISEEINVANQNKNKDINEKEKDDIHIVFSTDCSPYQDWQTLVLFHSATVVGQKGSITRIASGCDEKKKK